jgi:hypothetical protein
MSCTRWLCCGGPSGEGASPLLKSGAATIGLTELVEALSPLHQVSAATVEVEMSPVRGGRAVQAAGVVANWEVREPEHRPSNFVGAYGQREPRTCAPGGRRGVACGFGPMMASAPPSPWLRKAQLNAAGMVGGHGSEVVAAVGAGQPETGAV